MKISRNYSELIARVVTSQPLYYTFIVSKAWMILQAQTKILMEQILQRILMIHFLFSRAMATNQSIQNMKWTVWYTYSDGSETSEEDEKDSSRLEIINKICLQTNISTSCNQSIIYIYIVLYSNTIKQGKINKHIKT